MDRIVNFSDVNEILLLSELDALRVELLAVLLEVIDRLLEIQKHVAAALGV